jgi:hypothetical protein
MFEPGDKVKLIIGETSFNRVVLEIVDGAVYLTTGGDAFENSTGFVWGGKKSKIVAA